jgi:hypothetical protein
MTCSQIVARTELMRILAGLPEIQQIDAVLRTGRLSVDDWNRAIIDTRLFYIKHQAALWDTIRQQPDWAKGFASIAEASNFLICALQNDAGREAVEIIKEGAILCPLTEITKFISELTKLREISATCREIYRQHKNVNHMENVKRMEYENWLFYEFYRLYEEIKGARPGIAEPLYRFTTEGAKLVGLKVGLTEHAFRMRMQRVLKQQSKVGITGDALRMRIQRALNWHHTTSKAGIGL